MEEGVNSILGKEVIDGIDAACLFYGQEYKPYIERMYLGINSLSQNYPLVTTTTTVLASKLGEFIIQIKQSIIENGLDPDTFDEAMAMSWRGIAIAVSENQQIDNLEKIASFSQAKDRMLNIAHLFGANPTDNNYFDQSIALLERNINSFKDDNTYIIYADVVKASDVTLKWYGHRNSLPKVAKRLKDAGVIHSIQEFESAFMGTAGQTIRVDHAKLSQLIYMLSVLYQNKVIKSSDKKAIWTVLNATIVDFSNSPIKSDLKRYSYNVRKDAKGGNDCYNWITPFLRSIRLIG